MRGLQAPPMLTANLALCRLAGEIDSGTIPLGQLPCGSLVSMALRGRRGPVCSEDKLTSTLTIASGSETPHQECDRGGSKKVLAFAHPGLGECAFLPLAKWPV